MQPQPDPSGEVVRGSVLYVVPTLGRRPEYLKETLDSLLSQGHAGLSVLLVAPPDAVEVRATATARDVRYLAQQSEGLGGAINEGWCAFGAPYEYWAWLGDDDTLTPQSTARAVTCLQSHPRASMVYGRCEFVDETGATLFVAHPSRLAARLMRWGPNLVPQPGSVARAAAVRRSGLLDEDLAYSMDLDLFLRLQEVGPVRYLPELLATFRVHPTSTTVASAGESNAEARAVRARTWTGRRALGRHVEPLAMLLGRVLYRLHRSKG